MKLSAPLSSWLAVSGWGLAMDINIILDSGAVQRYHTTLMDVKQDNAQHQWETGIILRAIYPECSRDLLFYALTHDVGEVATSDIAAPFKRANPEMAEAINLTEKRFCLDVAGLPMFEPTEEERRALKYADLLSGLYFTTRRLIAGDLQAHKVRQTWMSYLASMPYLNEETARVAARLGDRNEYY